MDATEDLRQIWPAAFNASRPPLQIGVHTALGLPYGSYALRCWTNHPVYLRNLIAGQTRVNLQGAPCGTPTNLERAYAWRGLMFLRSEMVTRPPYGLTATEVRQEFKLRLPKPAKGWVLP